MKNAGDHMLHIHCTAMSSWAVSVSVKLCDVSLATTS